MRPHASFRFALAAFVLMVTATVPLHTLAAMIQATAKFNIDDTCHGFQGAVFDRPVVNHTGLTGRYNGTLHWTPDETQFAVFHVKIVPDESPDAPPPIFTAIQQQDGLKLDAEKTAVDVMILDHVEKPSEN